MTPVTYRYLGKGIGVLPWPSVLFAIAAGIWAALEGLLRRAR